MARSWRQNVIVGHGGQHGRKARSFRKGSAVTNEAARVIPDSVLGQSTQTSPAPPSPAPVPRAPEPGDRPEVRNLLEVGREEAGKPMEAPVEASERVEPTSKSEPGKAPVDDAAAMPEPAPTKEPAEGPQDPTTKRELLHMRAADVRDLAEKHGIVVEDVTGRTKMLRDLLATKLDL